MLTVRRRVEADDGPVAALLAASAERVTSLDPALWMTRFAGDGPGLVAVDDDGGIHGFVRPQARQLAPDDPERMYAPDRFVTWTDVAADSPAAVAALAAEIRATPDGAAADTVHWPAIDRRAEAWWTGAGFTCSAAYAVRPAGPLDGPLPDGVTARDAVPDDADAVVALHREAIAFQAGHSPYVRLLEPALESFRTRLLAGTRSVVLETSGGLVGVCEWWIVDGDSPLFRLAPGRYAYLNAVAVTAAARAGGLGRALAAAALRAAGDDLTGSTLWFSTHNPVAGTVWPHLGWRPTWSAWERRESVGGPA
jgi:GNAT superfamily N-acetyltransferase